MRLFRVEIDYLSNNVYFVLLAYFFVTNIISFFPCCVFAEKEEDEFVHMHGNDVNRSGMWLEARKIAHSEEKLKEVSYQAHKLISTPKIKIDKAKLVRKVLTFSDQQYQPINADMIQYSLVHEPEPEYPPHHIMKGLRADCVFHLWLVSWDEREEFELNGQVCSIYDLTYRN